MQLSKIADEVVVWASPVAAPGGGERVRTDDLLRARQLLSQLSYAPDWRLEYFPVLVGIGRLELPTSRLSGARSNQLSYIPRMSLRSFKEPARADL